MCYYMFQQYISIPKGDNTVDGNSSGSYKK